MKLTNIRHLGRFKNIITNKYYNIKTGYRTQRGTDHKFYLYRGERIYLSDRQFYDEYEKINEH